MGERQDRLEQRAKELSDEIRFLVNRIEAQHQIDGVDLARWAEKVADLLTLLRNHRVWLEQNGRPKPDDSP